MKRQVKKFERKLNPDTATVEKIQQTNDQLYTYLQEKGEKDAAKQLAYLMQNQAAPEKDDPKKNPVFDKLLVTNNKILDILAKIQKDMIDEQDTSIKSVAKEKISQTPVISGPTNITVEEAANDADGIGGFDIDLPDRRSKKSPKKGKGKGQPPRGKKDQKLPKKTSKTPKNTDKAGKTLKSATRAGGRIAGKALGGALKFAGPAGIIVTAGMAAYDAIEGWDNAPDTFGLEEGTDATFGQRAASSAGSAISGLTFGLADAKETAKGIYNLTGGNDAIKKYEKAGIIAHHTIGNSAVKNWTALTQLPSTEIQKIIDIDDWHEEDLDRMKKIKAVKEAQTTMVPFEQTPKEKIETESGIDDGKVFKKIDYQMKAVPQTVQPPALNATGSIGSSVKGAGVAKVSTSLNPDDYSVTDLFTLHNTSTLDVNGLEPNVLSNFKAMAAEYNDVYGKKIQINSAFRSFEEQAELKAKLGNMAAAPGSSMHNYGLAVDINSSDADNASKAGLFQKYGFHRPVAGEAWHVEPSGIDRAAIRAAGMKAGGAGTVLANNTKSVPTKQVGESESTKSPAAEVKAVAAKTKTLPVGEPKAIAKNTQTEQKIDQKSKELALTSDPEKKEQLADEIKTLTADYKDTQSTAMKNQSSGVIPQKTSELQVANLEQRALEATEVTSNKDQKESIVNQTNQSLTAQTVAYDTGTQVKAMNTIVPVINQSINSSKPQENIGQDRLLNLFS